VWATPATLRFAGGAEKVACFATGGAGDLDAVGRGVLPGAPELDRDAPVTFTGSWAGAGVDWRRAVEVLMGFFVAVEARSFTSTRCGLRG
jgi:hypothetical protein